MPTLINDFHVAVPTAFYKNEDLNTELTLQHIIYLYEQKGVKSVLVCGSTGEQHSLSCAEKLELLQAIESNDALADDLEIIFGVASVRLKEALELAKAVNKSRKVAAAMVGFPPYLRPTQQEASAYVKTLAKALDKKGVILYNNPRRTGFDLENKTLLKLLKNKSCANIIGIKETGDAYKVGQLIKFGLDDFYYYHGGEVCLSDNMLSGYNRLSSLLGNIDPKSIRQYFYDLRRRGRKGWCVPGEDVDASFRVDALLEKLWSMGSMIPALKQLISEQENIDMRYCRAPTGSK